LPPDKVEQIFDKIETRLKDQAKKSGGLKLTIPFVMINSNKKTVF
jgi:hypothetical protein